VARITSTAWFGPKRGLGWGWTPTSWQGWLVSLMWVVALVAGALVLALGGNAVVMLIFEALAIALFFVVVALTGDPPGGGFGRR
jgi:hypothetical protein